MSDTVSQRLDDLNRQIQVQRNVEMHAAMERARLETQRVELMSQMLTSSVAPPATLSPTSPYRVTWQTPMPAPDTAAVSQPPPNSPSHPADARRKHKPDGLPSVATMVETVLRDAPRRLAAVRYHCRYPPTLVAHADLRGRFEIACQACSSSSNALASFRSNVSNPSVNHP
jgi:hypothetical protein